VVHGACHLAYLDSGTESVFKNENMVSMEGFYFEIFNPHYNCIAERTVTSEIKDFIPIVFTFPHKIFVSRSICLQPFQMITCFCASLVRFLILSFHDNVPISVASQGPLSVLCSYCADYII
jgi:hypothetical protein